MDNLLNVLQNLVILILSNNVLIALVSFILLSALCFVIVIFKYYNKAVIKMMFSNSVKAISKLYKGQQVITNDKMVTQTYRIKLSWIDKLEIRYVDKPLLKKLVFFANIYVLFVVCIFLFIVGFWFSYIKVFHIGFSIVSGLLTASLLFIALDLRSKFLCDNIRNMMASWISILHKASYTKESVEYVLEASIHTINNPLRSYVEDCVIQIRNGLNEIEALDLLGMKVDSEQFQDFILNLKQNVKHRGDLNKLLNNCEDEFFTLQEEYERRKITTFAARIRIYIMMVAVLAVGYFLFALNPSFKEFYLYNPDGKWILTGFMAVYFAAFLISTKITNFNY